MKQVVLFILSGCLANPLIVRGAGGPPRQESPPVEARAWAFIEEVMSVGFAEFRSRNRSEPQSRDVRAAILAALPDQGSLVPTEAERAKLAALDAVFDLHNRLGAVDVKLVDVELALVAVHERAVLLITRQALSLVTPRELQAIGAHELAHEYFWKEFDAALSAGSYQRLQELELMCDGLAVMALRSLGLDAGHLVDAATTLTRFNERAAARIMTSRQVSLERRIAFIKRVAAVLDARQEAGAGAQGPSRRRRRRAGEREVPRVEGRSARRLTMLAGATRSSVPTQSHPGVSSS